MPLRRKDSKIRKVLRNNCCFFVQLCDLAPSRQLSDFSEQTQAWFFEFGVCDLGL
jgi:hypothetical protein